MGGLLNEREDGVIPFLYYHGLRLLGVAALARARPAGVILCYHNVVPPQAPPGGDPGAHLPLDRFSAQVSWLARRYRVVPLAEIADRLAAGRSLHGLAAITFDDGYAGALCYAWPVLRDLGLPVTTFVVANHPEDSGFWWDHSAVAQVEVSDRDRWLTTHRGDGVAILANLPAPDSVLPASHRTARWDLLTAAAAEGLTVGVHSFTHRTLTLLSDAELEREIVTSRDVIRQRTGTAPDFFAYPYGRWDRRVRDQVKGAGYRGAVTLDYGLVTRAADAWALPRVNVPASISPAAFESWTAGLAPVLRRRTIGSGARMASLLRQSEV